MYVLRYFARHPYMSVGIVLAVGMVIMLLLAARDVGLTSAQLAFLAVATVVVAGLCSWILSWESRDDA